MGSLVVELTSSGIQTSCVSTCSPAPQPGQKLLLCCIYTPTAYYHTSAHMTLVLLHHIGDVMSDNFTAFNTLSKHTVPLRLTLACLILLQSCLIP